METGIEIIKGSRHTDERGTLCFFNELDLSSIKRFYHIEHPDTKVIRAWQGHRYEQKWFHVLVGTFKIVLVKIDEWQNPSPDLPFEDFNISANDNLVLHLPGGYASGIKAAQPGSRLLVFSDFTLQQSMDDSYRYDKNLWYKW